MFATVIREYGLPAPGRADQTSANLTPASGRQDHTTSPYAATSLVSSLGDRSRSSKNPPCDPIARKTLPRPSHPAPNVRDDRETPLLVGRDGRSCRCDLGGTKTDLFLLTGLDRKIGTTPDGQIKSNRIAIRRNNELHPVKLEASRSCPGRGAAFSWRCQRVARMRAR